MNINENGTFDKQMFILGSVDGVREVAAADYGKVSMVIENENNYLVASFSVFIPK